MVDVEGAVEMRRESGRSGGRMMLEAWGRRREGLENGVVSEGSGVDQRRGDEAEKGEREERTG
ncbi:hypothetical protein [Natronococcus wangiae]|uniref:hypothetical protein n=1 Tax=Natronococcus wangiae TaxID=3068275 RepID=UPI00273E5844|nr:hypothetical protein [Natronococcus sp. AD5]